MREHPERRHIYAAVTNTRDRQEEIAEILGYQKMSSIRTVAWLAKYYYGIDWAIDYGRYLEKDQTEADDMPIKDMEYLYMLIQDDDGKDILLHIGSGDFVPEMFLRKDIHEFRAFAQSPLPLFVVPERASRGYQWDQKENLYGERIVKKFLDEHAIIYSPKWWEAIVRNPSKQGEVHINLGETNGIINEKDVMHALHYAIISKSSKDEHVREKHIRSIIELQWCSRQEFGKKVHARMHGHGDDEHAIFRMLNDIVDELTKENDDMDKESKRIDMMYTSMKMFDFKRHNH